ncbi:MAG TPA: LysM peptidoglycan-binding domain-containing protein [Candidatus Acidoferrales bacterium]|nr:LysM peptidoglycan-binding domain-containing protein [Candidatus Acidoferrales bacterium]
MLGAALLALAAMGCEDAARRPVQVHPPQASQEKSKAQTPAQPPVQAGNAAAIARPLPVDSPVLHRLILLPWPKADGREALIAQVQAAFQTGEQEYKAGHLESARRNFDRAVDWLLESGYDLQGDARLEELFHNIVDRVYAYEQAAFRAGDGFNEPPSEPAPIDEIAEMTFPVDPRLKVRAEQEVQAVSHDLPLTVNDTVLSFVNFFQTPRGRTIVEGGLRRAGRYRDMIQRVFREEGIPLDLMYLAQAESGFKPLALSKASARGMWQFMAFTGRLYGLQHTWWVDERQDPEKATRAAARHLRDLYEKFGDWYLAMAAYDSGEGNVQKAVERTGYADFWELYKRNVLPRETRNYVPIILALALVAKDAPHYGIQVEAESADPVDVIKPGRPIDLRLVAETIDTDVATLRALNPALLRMVTPADPEFELRLPRGTTEKFFAEIATIPPEKWVSWRRHRVEEGETLSTIARHYQVTAAAIADANGLEKSAPLKVGEKLIIPSARSEMAQGKLVRYRVRRGDTIVSIAEQFSVDVDELRRWNGLRSNRVRRGMSLRVYPGGLPPSVSKAGKKKSHPAAAHPAPEAARAPETPSPAAAPGGPANGTMTVHRVKPGETLWSLASSYGTSVEALRQANPFLASRQLQAGDRLRIPSPN